MTDRTAAAQVGLLLVLAALACFYGLVPVFPAVAGVALVRALATAVLG